MLRRLYDWTLRLARHPHALWYMGAISFIESSVFPLPPDLLLIPMVLAARARAWQIALVTTLASVAGGFCGYGIGYFFWDMAGSRIVDFYGYTYQFEYLKARYNEWGAWIVAMAGFTPFPYKVITIASGVTHLDPLTFGLASLGSRGARFFLEAALLWRFGPPIRDFIEGNLAKLSWLFFALLFGGFLAVRYLL